MNVYGKDKRGTIEVEPCPTCGKEVSQYCRFEPDYRRIQVPAKVITCRCGHEVVSYGAWDDAITEWNWRVSGKPSKVNTPQSPVDRKIKLTFVGIDDWGFPNYKTPKGILVVDLEPENERASLFRKTGNDPDGEADMPMAQGVEVTFFPERIRT